MARTRLLAIVPAICLFAGGAAAQTAPSIDARSWRPSTDPDSSLVLEPATTPGPWRWNLGAWAQYARSPVSLRDTTGTVASRPVDHLVGADVVAGLGLGRRGAIGVDLPVFLWQSGTKALPETVVSGGAVSASGVGDVSVSGKAAIVSNDRDGVRIGFGLAALSAVSFPTGNTKSFAGEGSVTASLRLLIEYAFGVGAMRGSAGYALRTDPRTWPTVGGVAFGDAIPWSFGLVLRPKAIAPAVDTGDRQLWEIALHGAVPAGPVAPFAPGAASLSPAMLAVDDRIALGSYGDAYVLLGADIGLDTAVGVPLVRAVVSFGWEPRPHDRDADGVPDDADQCPDLPEDRDGIQDADGCPEDDADGDGVLDPQDACPLVPGVASDDPRRNGCPGPAAPKPMPSEGSK